MSAARQIKPDRDRFAEIPAPSGSNSGSAGHLGNLTARRQSAPIGMDGPKSPVDGHTIQRAAVVDLGLAQQVRRAIADSQGRSLPWPHGQKETTSGSAQGGQENPASATALWGMAGSDGPGGAAHADSHRHARLARLCREKWSSHAPEEGEWIATDCDCWHRAPIVTVSWARRCSE